MFEILHVEDDPADAMLTRKAFERCDVDAQISLVVDGVEALEFLHNEGQYKGASRPDVILLDLNLPKKNGRAVLAEVKAELELKGVPIFVLSSSSAAQDIQEVHDLHANGYITKPIGLAEYKAVANMIANFMSLTTRLPSTRAAAWQKV